MLLGFLGASLLRNLLTGQGMYRAGKGKGINRAGEGIVRAGYGRPYYLFIYLFTLYFKLTYTVKNITVKIK